MRPPPVLMNGNQTWQKKLSLAGEKSTFPNDVTKLSGGTK